MKYLSAAITAMVGWLFRKAHIAYVPYYRDYDGLGNRVKGLANFYARGYRRFLMLWNTKSWVTERWDRLFELRGASVCAVHPENVLYSLLKFFFRRFMPAGVVREERPFWSFILPSHLQRDEFRHKWHFSHIPSYSVDWWFNRVPDDIREYYCGYFSVLRPSSCVLERIRGGGAHGCYRCPNQKFKSSGG